MPNLIEDMRRCNADYGRASGYVYAEAFKGCIPSAIPELSQAAP